MFITSVRWLRIGLTLFLLAWIALARPVLAAGVLDGFDPHADGTVVATAMQRDGKLLVGGAFTHIGGQPRSHVARFNADGTLDAGFSPSVDGTVHAIALQPDGMVVLGGRFTTVDGQPRLRIARLKADGSVDTGFSPGAEGGANGGVVNSLALQLNGKWVVGGDFTSINGQSRNYLARLNTDGTLDQGFIHDTNGVVNVLALQPGGKLVVGGDFTAIDNRQRIHIARLNADDSIDDGFNPGAENGPVFNLASQSDGKLVLGGDFTQVAGQVRHYIARLHVDGSLDTGFVASADNPVGSLALQPDGKLVVGGNFSTFNGQPRARMARLNADGTLDAGFHPGVDGWVYSLAVQPDGRLVLGGTFTQAAGQPRSRIARLNSDGSLDAETRSGVDDRVYGLAQQRDGKLLVGGVFATLGGVTRNNIGRLNGDGTPDTGFNPGASSTVAGFVVQPDGKRVVFGGFNQLAGQPRQFIARLNADDSLDNDFNPVVNNQIRSMVLQPDGKLLLGGTFTKVGGVTRNRVARLNSDGSLDEGFNASMNSQVASLALQPDGKVVVGGLFTSVNGTPSARIARLNADGSLDVDFTPSVDKQVHVIALQPDGKLVLGGDFTLVNGQQRNHLARLNTNGSLDLDFDPNVNGNSGGTVYSIALQADGQLLVGGAFGSIGGQPRNNIARLTSSGTVDAALDPNANEPYSAGVNVYSIALQADGKLAVGGDFTSLGARPRQAMARVSPPEAALQQLVAAGNTGLRWLRSGSGPELSQVRFALSTTGADAPEAGWQDLGPGERIPGGWQLNGLDLPRDSTVWVRAQGVATGGQYGGSSGLVRSVRLHYLASSTPTPPDAPVAVQAVPGAGQITLGWTAPANDGGSAITGYRVEVAGDPGKFCMAPAHGTSCVITGLTNGQNYTFNVVARNVVGNSVAASISGAPSATAPDAPGSVQALAGGGQVTVTWMAPANDGGSAITGYRVEVAGDAGKFCTAPADGTSCTVIGLTNGLSYTFNVVARNVVGDSPAAIASATPTGSAMPPHPPRRAQTLAGDRQVTITWDAPSSDGGSAITGYRVEVVGDSSKSCTAVASQNQCTVTGLTNQQVYDFNVVARNIVGDSAPATAGPATPIGSIIAPGGDLPAGVQGQPYLARLPLSGGLAPYRFAIVGGQLPAGLNAALSADGRSIEFSGTPTRVEVAHFTLHIADATFAGPLSAQLLKADPVAHDVTVEKRITINAAPINAAPTPVPTLGAWALVLLSLALAGFAAMGLGSMRRG